MQFNRVTLADRSLIDSYMMRYGEGSCQHSFIAMFGMQGKYGDMFCTEDGVLFVYRRGLSDSDKEAFLIPMGEPCENDEGLKRAVLKLLDYAHSQGKKIEINTLTEKNSDRVTGLFPELFRAEEARDSFEYIHEFDSLAFLNGPKFARRRQDLNSFNRTFGDRTQIKIIEESDMEDLREFQTYWNDDFREICIAKGKKIIDHENVGIMKSFDRFFELGLSGIVLRVEGVVRDTPTGPLFRTMSTTFLSKKETEGSKTFIVRSIRSS